MLFLLISAIGILILDNKHDENLVAVSLINYFKSDAQLDGIVIYSMPTDCGIDDELSDQYHRLFSRDLIENFLLANNDSSSPLRLSSLEGKVNLMKWDDNLSIFKTGNIAFAFRKSSKHLVRLSRVGFNKEQNKAIICVEPKGSGSLFMFEKINEKWKHKSEQNIWVS